MNCNEFVIETVTAAVRRYIETTGEPPKRRTPLETHPRRVSGEVDLVDQRYERHPVLLAGFILPNNVE